MIEYLISLLAITILAATTIITTVLLVFRDDFRAAWTEYKQTRKSVNAILGQGVESVKLDRQEVVQQLPAINHLTTTLPITAKERIKTKIAGFDVQDKVNFLAGNQSRHFSGVSRALFDDHFHEVYAVSLDELNIPSFVVASRKNPHWSETRSLQRQSRYRDQVKLVPSQKQKRFA